MGGLANVTPSSLSAEGLNRVPLDKFRESGENYLPDMKNRPKVLVANEVVRYGDNLWRQVSASSLDQNAFHPRKGKTGESRRRKAMGLHPLGQTRTTGL